MAQRRRTHEPTDKLRSEVALLSGLGLRQEDICMVVGVSLPTLHKYYREELDLGMAKANANVARALYRQAIDEGNTTAMIFWLKCRARWRETSALELTGQDGAPLTAPNIVVNFVDPKDKEE